MNRTLVSITVAAAFAAPGFAFAQSTVTISGQIKALVGNVKYGNKSAARTGNSSETRFQDDSSRIIFSVREDLGNGLAAIGQLDLRYTIDGSGTSGIGSSAGNNFVGLQSASLGQLRLGSIEQHSTLLGGELTSYAPSQISVGSLLNYAHVAAPVAGAYTGTVQGQIAGDSRTRNAVRWDSPNWSGFTLGAGYSTNTTGGQEGDLTNAPATLRKGRSLNLNPQYAADTWRVGYSYFDDKRDATGAAGDWKGHRLYGQVSFSGFTAGLVYDRNKVRNAATGAANSNRRAWAVPLRYETGPHVITASYAQAGDDKVYAGGNTGARFWAFSYGYLLSKRTSLGIGYARINNDALASYSLYKEYAATPATSNGTNTANSGSYSGEDPSYLGVAVRHAF